MGRRFFICVCLFAAWLPIGQCGWGDSLTETFGRATEQVGRGLSTARDSIVDGYNTVSQQTSHFVGKIDVFGTLKYNGVKAGKKPRPENGHVIVWNGTVKMVRGIGFSDKAEMDSGSNITMPKYGKSCKKPTVRYPILNTTDQVYKGPKGDKLRRSSFRPCNDRKSGTGNAGTRIGSFGSRYRRSETYTHPGLLWKSNKILYAVDPRVPESMNETITSAINMWAEGTCLVFQKVVVQLKLRRRRSVMTESRQILEKESYILFSWEGGPCSTDRNGPNLVVPYKTTIDVSNCRNSIGTIGHEIGNALGLSHSQKRADRDKYVQIFKQNVADSWAAQFEKNSPDHFDSWGIEYYYDSIMHYPAYAASKNGLMTICPLDPLAEVIMGQREEPGFGDLALVNYMYCKESCFSTKELNGMQNGGGKSRTISERKCQNWSSQTPHRHNFGSLGNDSSCRNPDNWEGGLWCFTIDPNVPYEPCFSSCEDMKRINFPSCPGWCRNGGYHDPTNCTCICPGHTSGQYCETVIPRTAHPYLACGGKKELVNIGDQMVIMSPNFPSNYTENSVCMWWLVAPQNGRVKLTISEFSLEIPDQNGCYDYLEIRPSICAVAIENSDKMRFCGNSLAATNGTSRQMLSDDNNMVLKFYADETENGKGFKVIAEAVAAAN